jgi:hypothetical protein
MKCKSFEVVAGYKLESGINSNEYFEYTDSVYCELPISLSEIEEVIRRKARHARDICVTSIKEAQS